MNEPTPERSIDWMAYFARSESLKPRSEADADWLMLSTEGTPVLPSVAPPAHCSRFRDEALAAAQLQPLPTRRPKEWSLRP